MPFLPEPMPERFVQMRFLPISVKPPHLPALDESPEPSPMLSVGLHVRTKDNNGLKIIPTKELLIAIGTDKAPEASTHSLPITFARALAQRILEMCNGVAE